MPPDLDTAVIHGTSLDSPIGRLWVRARRGKLYEIVIHGGQDDSAELFVGETQGIALEDQRVLEMAARQLEAYFSGRLQRFTLPLDLTGRSSFAHACLECLATIGYGQLLSYGELARRAGNPAAARAVGRVMAGNLLPIVLPCHRVVSAGGTLTGYSSGAGLTTKAWLLQHESRFV